MRAESIFWIASRLTSCACFVTAGFTTPPTTPSRTAVGTFPRGASSLNYFSEHSNSWDRSSPQQYGSQDAMWENSVGFDNGMRERPSWSQNEFPSQNNNARDGINFEQFSASRQYRDGPRQMNIGYGGGPNPYLSEREFQQQYRSEDSDQVSDGDYQRPVSNGQNSFAGNRNYQWNDPQMNPIGRKEDSFLRQPQRRGYDYDDYFVDKNYYDEQPGKNGYEYDRSSRLPRQAMRQMERQQYRWPYDMGFEADEAMARGMVMSPLRGFEMMDRMLNDMIEGIGMINDAMDRLNFGMETRLGQDQALLDNVIDDAYAYLIADPEVAEMVGDSIRLGMPNAQSSSSFVMNGVRRSRLELIIPIKGSRSMGQLRLLADEEGISRLEVGVDGRVIDVQGGGRKSYNQRKNIDDEVIDATLVE